MRKHQPGILDQGQKLTRNPVRGKWTRFDVNPIESRLAKPFIVETVKVPSSPIQPVILVQDEISHTSPPGVSKENLWRVWCEEGGFSDLAINWGLLFFSLYEFFGLWSQKGLKSPFVLQPLYVRK